MEITVICLRVRGEVIFMIAFFPKKILKTKKKRLLKLTGASIPARNI